MCRSEPASSVKSHHSTSGTAPGIGKALMDNIEIDDYNESFNTGVWGSGNTETTTTTTNLGYAADGSFNTDESTNDSGNLDLGIADSFNQDSNDTTTDITDSWNDYMLLA